MPNLLWFSINIKSISILNMVDSFKADRYYASFISGNADGSWQAKINLEFEGKLVAQFLFYKDGAKKPTNTWPSGSYMIMHFDLSQLTNIMTLIRNHRPIYLQFDRKSNLGWVSTEKELMGQGEIPQR